MLFLICLELVCVSVGEVYMVGGRRGTESFHSFLRLRFLSSSQQEEGVGGKRGKGKEEEGVGKGRGKEGGTDGCLWEAGNASDCAAMQTQHPGSSFAPPISLPFLH